MRKGKLTLENSVVNHCSLEGTVSLELLYKGLRKNKTVNNFFFFLIINTIFCIANAMVLNFRRKVVMTGVFFMEFMPKKCVMCAQSLPARLGFLENRHNLQS